MRTASALDGNDVRTAGTATYETGQTRQFFHGRTETVRSFCAESVEWTKAMTDESASKQKRIELLRKAIDHHSKTLMADSTNGSCTLSLSLSPGALISTDSSVDIAARGVDRHLLGLKLVAMEDEEEKSLGVPELFKDRAYAESSTFRLSTSNMPGKLYISGFGPVAGDGYGVCYGTRNDMLQFTITSLRSCPTTGAYAERASSVATVWPATDMGTSTDSIRMRETLHNTLVEMGNLFADVSQAKL
jgi:carnitine O-acetyltransferase